MPLTADEQDLVMSAVQFAFRVGRCDGARSGRHDGIPDGLWPIVLGTFPELGALLPERVTSESREGGRALDDNGAGGSGNST